MWSKWKQNNKIEKWQANGKLSIRIYSAHLQVTSNHSVKTQLCSVSSQASTDNQKPRYWTYIKTCSLNIGCKSGSCLTAPSNLKKILHNHFVILSLQLVLIKWLNSVNTCQHSRTKEISEGLSKVMIFILKPLDTFWTEQKLKVLRFTNNLQRLRLSILDIENNRFILNTCHDTAKCAKRAKTTVCFSAIFSWHRWPIERKFSQFCYFIYNMWYTKCWAMDNTFYQCWAIALRLKDKETVHDHIVFVLLILRIICYIFWIITCKSADAAICKCNESLLN